MDCYKSAIKLFCCAEIHFHDTNSNEKFLVKIKGKKKNLIIIER